MSTFSVTLGNVALTLAYLLGGYFLRRIRKVQPAHMGSVSAILLYLCGPCMFVNALISLDASTELSLRMLWFFLFTLISEILFMLLIFLLLGRRRKEFAWRIAVLASLMGNVGFFGLPIVRAVFPEAPEAAAYSCIFCVSMNILAWTIGVFFLTDDRRYMSLRAAVVNPTVLSVLAGFALYLLSAKHWLPAVVQDGFRTVGSMSTPLCMFVLGIRLSTMRFRDLFDRPTVWFAVVGKLLIFPLFSYAVVLLLPLPEVFRASILILSATPCASIILNLAEIHQHGQDLAANCALLSTLLSVVTIPLLSLLL